MIPIEKVKAIIVKHDVLEKELSSGNVVSKDYAQKSKEYSELSNIIKLAREYIKIDEDKKGLEQIINDKKSDKDMLALADKELIILKEKKGKYENRLKIFLLPKDSDDQKNAIVEIRAGTGGLEATLFCADLFRMYEKVCSKKKWKLELINISKSEAGGFKEVIFLVNGEDIYSYLKYESGVHRVQRVPDTETQGRVHTSAATVAVLPEAEDVDIELNESDLKIDTYRASGAGGQHVNKTESAIRITHLPTNLVVTCQDESSQHKNRAAALKVLKSRLLAQEKEKVDAKRAAERKSLVSTGDRSAKIRTYNFPQGRVTDHRINFTTHRLNEILDGDINEIIEKLKITEQQELLSSSMS